MEDCEVYCNYENYKIIMNNEHEDIDEKLIIIINKENNDVIYTYKTNIKNSTLNKLNLKFSTRVLMDIIINKDFTLMDYFNELIITVNYSIKNLENDIKITIPRKDITCINHHNNRDLSIIPNIYRYIKLDNNITIGSYNIPITYFESLLSSHTNIFYISISSQLNWKYLANVLNKNDNIHTLEITNPILSSIMYDIETMNMPYKFMHIKLVIYDPTRGMPIIRLFPNIKYYGIFNIQSNIYKIYKIINHDDVDITISKLLKAIESYDKYKLLNFVSRYCK